MNFDYAEDGLVPSSRKYPDVFATLDDDGAAASQQRNWWHVNVYELDRRYGGPEEGGWWYDAGDVVHSIPVFTLTDEEIDRLLDAMKKQYPEHTGPYEITSMAYQGGDYLVRVENSEGRSWPEERPFYE